MVNCQSFKRFFHIFCLSLGASRLGSENGCGAEWGGRGYRIWRFRGHGNFRDGIGEGEDETRTYLVGFGSH